MLNKHFEWVIEHWWDTPCAKHCQAYLGESILKAETGVWPLASHYLHFCPCYHLLHNGGDSGVERQGRYLWRINIMNKAQRWGNKKELERVWGGFKDLPVPDLWESPAFTSNATFFPNAFHVPWKAISFKSL